MATKTRCNFKPQRIYHECMNEGLRNILCMDEQVFDNLWRKQTRGHLNLSDSVWLCLTLSRTFCNLIMNSTICVRRKDSCHTFHSGHNNWSQWNEKFVSKHLETQNQTWHSRFAWEVTGSSQVMTDRSHEFLQTLGNDVTWLGVARATIRRFPKMGVPLNHHYKHYKPSILGYPPF